MLRELLLSGIIICVLIIVKIILNILVNYSAQKKKSTPNSVKLVKKIISVGLALFGIMLLIILWGFNLQNLWVFLTTFITLIAVGFVAVWSMLSNILAGVIIFFTRAVKTGDTVTIIPEKVTGTVIRVGVIFIVLKTPKKGNIKIPNNLIFQRIIITKKA